MHTILVVPRQAQILSSRLRFFKMSVVKSDIWYFPTLAHGDMGQIPP